MENEKEIIVKCKWGSQGAVSSSKGSSWSPFTSGGQVNRLT